MRIDAPLFRDNLNEYLAAGFVIAGTVACGLALAGASFPVHAASKQAQAAGGVMFQDKGCQHCHGIDATGTDRGPDLSTVGKKWHKDRIEQQIREGGGGMPAFGEVLRPDEIKSLVDFLSAKRRSGNKSGKSSAPEKSSAAKPTSDDSSQ